jgi:lysozyme
MPDIKGIDLASYQGEPRQWVHEPAAQGMEWAAVKFTEVSPQGVYDNPTAKADWDYLWEHKLGRVAYLFAHPSASVQHTLDAFKAMTGKLGLLPEDGVAVDLEVTDGLSPAAVASFARELCAALAATYGRRPIVYTNLDTARRGNCEGLENYFLWIANPGRPAGLPEVPGPWKDWFAQQYNLAPPVDQDVAHFSSLAAMQAAMGAPRFHTVVAVHVTTGGESLVNLSHILQTEISTIIRLTLNGSANHMFTDDLADYLDFGNFQALMPKGVTLRFYERVRS